MRLRSILLALVSLVVVILLWVLGPSLEVRPSGEGVEPPTLQGDTGPLHVPVAVEERTDVVVDRTAVTPLATSVPRHLHGTLLNADGLPVPGCKFGAGAVDDTTRRWPPAPVAPVDGATGPQGEWTLVHDPAANSPPTITFHPHPGVSVTYSLERYDPEKDHDLALPPFSELVVRMLDAPGRWWVIIDPRPPGDQYRFEGGYGPVVVTSSRFRSDHRDGPGRVTVAGLPGTCCRVLAQGLQAEFGPRWPEACFPGTVDFHPLETVPGITVRIVEAGTGEVSDIGGNVVYFYRNDKGAVPDFAREPIVDGEGNLGMIPGAAFPAEFLENPDAIEVVCVLDNGEHFATGTGVFEDFGVKPRQVVTFLQGTGIKPVRIRDERLDDVVEIYADVTDREIRSIRIARTNVPTIVPPWGELFTRLDDGSGVVSLGSREWIRMWLVRADGVIGMITYGTGELPVQWAEPTVEAEVPVQSLLAGTEWRDMSGRIQLHVEVQLPGHRGNRWIRVGSRTLHTPRDLERPEGWRWKFPVAPQELGFAYRVLGSVSGRRGQLSPLLFR